MRKIPLAVGAILALGTLAAGQSAKRKATQKTLTLPEAIELIRPSVMQIMIRVQPPPQQAGGMQMPQRPQTAPLGTGFFVNTDAYAVTARHVVELFQNIPVQSGANKRLVVGLATPNLVNFKSGGTSLNIRGSFVLTEVDIVDEDARHDLALLKLRQNPFKGELAVTLIQVPNASIGLPQQRVAILSVGHPQDGEAIAISGYPLSSNVLVTTSGNLASSWAYETEEVHVPGAPEWFTTFDTADSYLADMHVNPGNSGGPVYSVKRGHVIGVCVSYPFTPVRYGDGNHEPASSGGRPLMANSELANVVPSRYVVDLLKKHNLKWEEAK